MEQSGSQKVLKVLSILGIIFGVITLLFAGLAFWGSSAMVVETEAISDAASNAELAGMTLVLAIASLVEGLLYILQGVLGLRAAKDNQKIMPVWILAVIGLVFGVLGVIAAITNSEPAELMSNLGSSILSLVYSGIYFYITNTIKKEAGK